MMQTYNLIEVSLFGGILSIHTSNIDSFTINYNSFGYYIKALKALKKHL